MNLLLVCEVTAGLRIPGFGGALEGHLTGKHHPRVHAASLTAWNLLAHGLQLLGMDTLPRVYFEPAGRPYFDECPLYFSIAHSESLAAVLISDCACAVDIEAVRPQVREKLIKRCLSDAEQAAKLDFFECWTKKECIGKLSGQGLPAHPAEIDSLSPEYAQPFFLHRIADVGGQEYVLAALCTNEEAPEIKKIVPERLI